MYPLSAPSAASSPFTFSSAPSGGFGASQAPSFGSSFGSPFTAPPSQSPPTFGANPNPNPTPVFGQQANSTPAFGANANSSAGGYLSQLHLSSPASLFRHRCVVFNRRRLPVWSQWIWSHEQHFRCFYFRCRSGCISCPPCQPSHPTPDWSSWAWIQLCTSPLLQYRVGCAYLCTFAAMLASFSALCDRNDGKLLSSSSTKSFTASPAGQQAIAGRKFKMAVRRRK